MKTTEANKKKLKTDFLGSTHFFRKRQEQIFGRHQLEVAKSLDLQKSRVYGDKKGRSLYTSRDDVFRQKSEDFNWYRASCIYVTAYNIIREETDANDIFLECNEELQKKYDVFESNGEEETEPMAIEVISEIEFHVAIRAVEGDSDTLIWIGNVLSTFQDESGSVCKLLVHSFDMRSVEQSLFGRYFPSFHHNDHVKPHGAAWTDEKSTGVVPKISLTWS